MAVETVATSGGIPPEAYNMAAAIAAQNALNRGLPMDAAVEEARKAKEADEGVAAKPDAIPANGDKYRRYLLSICHIMHGRFAHLSTQRLEEIVRIHPGTGIRSFEQWQADE